MNRKLITMILTGAGVLLIVMSFILLCVSAGFIGDLENMLDLAAASELGAGIDIDLDADLVRTAVDIVDDLPDELTEGMDIPGMLRMIGIKGAGFKIFALNARCWCFGLGLVSLIAAAVMMAIEANKELGAQALALVKAFGAAVVTGFNSMISGISFKLPGFVSRAAGAKKPVYTCPSCGAAFREGTAFCGTCGAKLPDVASIGICKNCGTRNDASARFCSGCGQPLE